MPDGVEVERHLLDNGQAVAVLPYDPVRRVVMLVTQPRAAVLAAGEEADLLEAIAGNLDAATPEARILAEAMEEGGLQLGALEPVANIWPIPPVSTERVMLYLAPWAADRVGPGGGHEDEHENIHVVEIGLDALYAMVMAGTLEDAKTLTLAQALIIRHPELFTR
jgi:nudix-type nucleoside diphosphatase (YffH/AdpP family)